MSSAAQAPSDIRPDGHSIVFAPDVPLTSSPDSHRNMDQGRSQELGKRILRDIIAIFKLRATALIVMTTWAGYYLGAKESGSDAFSLVMWNTLIGMALVSGGSSVLNQVIEHRSDALMKRTMHRPLAANRMRLGYGIVIGLVAILGGSLWLMTEVNAISGTLTLLAAVMYVGIYTPLKRYTTLATFIGAFPGAVPPLIGWVAARGHIEWPAVVLFAMLFVWQFPHFMSIAWLYREDYGRAGIRMLPVVEPDGRSTAVEALVYAILMIPVSLAPYYLHIAGRIYWIAALALGVGYLAYTIRFARISRCSPGQSRRYARDLLKASVIYLPLLLIVMMVNATGKG